ncbi:hypothetical protein N3K66_005837 [Trichothecium roseum]|uniref:Uncharacterized protein n=1 Tax=Trichothecium roseum TaxID=47278 RepID=A0ACC0UZ46_9HYPO|nr:hypothetical protein N3K66_005837 [Trichothecium roseum]
MAPFKSGPAAAAAVAPLGPTDETCPVCKNSRYFNPDMEFRVNPECYHRMCLTCVTRIFKDGPNQCPHAGCRKTLRERGFKKAYFGDLAVEREVDIRRRVAAVFNKEEEDFEALAAYNDYLDMVECLTDDLVNGGDAARARAEAELAEWEAQHKADIERNKALAREKDSARLRREMEEQEAARRRREAEVREEADERASAARFREEMLDSLQSADAGQASAVYNKALALKRGQSKRDAALQAAGAGSGAATAASSLSIRGLREKKTHVVDAGPYDPYGGLDLAPKRVDIVPANLAAYSNEWVEIARTKPEYKVGGYDADEYISRALYEAFSGLGVFMEEDKGAKSISTKAAARAAVDKV